MEQKEQILQIATDLFLKNGIRRVSVDEICAELRISKKTFYTSFKNKEELVDEFLQYSMTMLKERFLKQVKNKNAIESLLLGIKEMQKNIDTISDLVMQDTVKYYPQLYKKYSQLQDEEMRYIFQRNMQQGVEEGYYREDLDVEMLSMFQSMHFKRKYTKMDELLCHQFPKKRIMNFFSDMIIRLIVNEKGQQFVNEQKNQNKTEIN